MKNTRAEELQFAGENELIRSRLFIPLDYDTSEFPTVIALGNNNQAVTVSGSSEYGTVMIRTLGHGNATLPADVLKSAIDLAAAQL